MSLIIRFQNCKKCNNCTINNNYILYVNYTFINETHQKETK